MARVYYFPDEIRRRQAMTPSPLEPGLCGDCQHCRIVQSDKLSVFYRCLRAAEDSRYSKYPPLPVLACPGYERQLSPDQ
ncbi:MAG: hypothetical protein WDO18_18195 [Acidobacteriota bacterium]